jgi:[CysO sulfur-carrier protein]-S-L-cysteine hydrolase
VNSSDPPTLVIPTNILDEMRTDVLQRMPEEACGLLAGRGQTIETGWRITNVWHSPTQFQMDAREQVRAMLAIEAGGLDLLAIYHSHPMGPDHPSQTDLERFAYPGVYYLIWAPESGNPSQSPVPNLGLHAFSITQNEVREILIKPSNTPGTFVLY